MHAVSRGSGPAVLFCHGFPGLWYSWRHQLPAVPETAFIGGLNSYRAMDLNWEHDPDYGRRQVQQPALFIAGEQDPVLQMLTRKTLETMPNRVADLRNIVLIPGAGHFVQQERAEAVNRHLLEFLDSLR